jgi:hypothetical protein
MRSYSPWVDVTAQKLIVIANAVIREGREGKDKKVTGTDLTAYRRERAGPIMAALANWLAEQRPRVLPKSSIGEAITYASNQWHTLGA